MSRWTAGERGDLRSRTPCRASRVLPGISGRTRRIPDGGTARANKCDRSHSAAVFWVLDSGGGRVLDPTAVVTVPGYGPVPVPRTLILRMPVGYGQPVAIRRPCVRDTTRRPTDGGEPGIRLLSVSTDTDGPQPNRSGKARRRGKACQPRRVAPTRT